MMLAQHYPGAFDGILAIAPAIHYGPLMGSLYHQQAVMNALGEYPPNCEFESITAKAIAACDGLDGVYDGIIDHPPLCRFDPFSVVGESASCGNNTNTTISQAAAIAANASWGGVFTQQGRPLYPSYTRDAPLVTTADTDCAATGNCSLAAWYIAANWFRDFIAKNSSFDLSTITSANLARYVHASIQEYDSIIGTNDADLTASRRAVRNS